MACKFKETGYWLTDARIDEVQIDEGGWRAFSVKDRARRAKKEMEMETTLMLNFGPIKAWKIRY